MITRKEWGRDGMIMRENVRKTIGWHTYFGMMSQESYLVSLCMYRVMTCLYSVCLSNHYVFVITYLYDTGKGSSTHEAASLLFYYHSYLRLFSLSEYTVSSLC